jgi:thioredoxin 1
MPLTTAPETAPSSPPDLPVNWVICLCADWCGLCRDYNLVFTQMAARYPASRFAWLDIEDQADLVGDIEVETFRRCWSLTPAARAFWGLSRRTRKPCRACWIRWRNPAKATPHLPSTQALLQALQARRSIG